MAIIYDVRGNEFMGTLDQLGGQTLTEGRAVTQNIAALNGEVLLDLNGHSTMLVDFRGTFTATCVFEGSVDGTNYITLAGLNVVTQAYAVAVTTTGTTFAVNVAGFRRARIRASAFTSGPVIVGARASGADAVIQVERLPMTLGITATGASGAGVTLTVPLVAGLFHYFDSIRVEHFAVATLTAAATPVLVTTTNLPGTPTINFRADAAPQGTLTERVFNFGAPFRSTAAGTNTTVVCPVTTNVIWRATAIYRLGY
jgi:hypothetical protein